MGGPPPQPQLHSESLLKKERGKEGHSRQKSKDFAAFDHFYHYQRLQRYHQRQAFALMPAWQVGEAEESISGSDIVVQHQEEWIMISDDELMIMVWWLIELGVSELWL